MPDNFVQVNRVLKVSADAAWLQPPGCTAVWSGLWLARHVPRMCLRFTHTAPELRLEVGNLQKECRVQAQSWKSLAAA